MVLLAPSISLDAEVDRFRFPLSWARHGVGVEVARTAWFPGVAIPMEVGIDALKVAGAAIFGVRGGFRGKVASLDDIAFCLGRLFFKGRGGGGMAALAVVTVAVGGLVDAFDGADIKLVEHPRLWGDRGSGNRAAIGFDERETDFFGRGDEAVAADGVEARLLEEDEAEEVIPEDDNLGLFIDSDANMSEISWP